MNPRSGEDRRCRGDESEFESMNQSTSQNPASVAPTPVRDAGDKENRMRIKHLKWSVVPAVAAALALTVATGASAANVTATATVNAGTLALTTSASPSVSVTLDGTDQTPTYTLPMTVNDATGSGTGWNVTR